MHPLRAARARQQLSILELSEKSGVDRNTIAYIENGEREPRVITLARLADALGVDVTELEPEREVPERGRYTPGKAPTLV